MISIFRAKELDSNAIVNIGTISVGDAHRDSCSAEDLQEYLERNYNDDSIKKELNDSKNIYHIIKFNETPVGFSKIVLNYSHDKIEQKNISKLDRIYLLKEFHGLKLGSKLLEFNIELAKRNSQSGIWLFTWVGNSKAVNFYTKYGFKIIGSHMFQVSETHYNENHHMFFQFS